MVTANSLSQDLNFRLIDLTRSSAPEDEELARLARETVGQLVSALKPILHYVCTPEKNKKVVVIADKDTGWNDSWIGLAEDGNFGLLQGGSFTDRSDVWHMMNFQDFLDCLQRVFREAEDKRRTHLDAVAKRRELLEGIQELIKNSTQK